MANSNVTDIMKILHSIKSEHYSDPSFYSICYKPAKFLNFLSKGKLIISCSHFQSLNEELKKMFPNLYFASEGDAFVGATWYECSMKKNEAKEALVELKMLGYEIN